MLTNKMVITLCTVTFGAVYIISAYISPHVARIIIGG